ncbi:MAG: hypothetical protein JWQ27_1278 [Ferruginibacter sp.]|nr:hypothetical protein [Ferruginibacter sp.]
MNPYFKAHQILLLCGFLAGLLALKKSRILLPVTIIFIVTAVSELTGFFTTKYYRNNLPEFHVLNFLLIPLTAWFFYIHLESPVFKKWVRWLAAAAMAFAVFNTILNGFKSFPENALKVSSCAVLVMATFLFIELMDRPAKENIFKNPVFIVTLAMIWVNLTSFVFWLLFSYFADHHIPGKPLTLLHYVSNYVYYGLMLIAQIFTYTSIKYHGKATIA